MENSLNFNGKSLPLKFEFFNRKSKKNYQIKKNVSSLDQFWDHGVKVTSLTLRVGGLV